MIMDRRIYDVKPIKEYTDEEVADLLKLPKTQWQYDYLIDRLFFYDPDEVKKRRTLEYPVLTARSLLRRSRRDILSYDVLEDR